MASPASAAVSTPVFLREDFQPLENLKLMYEKNATKTKELYDLENSDELHTIGKRMRLALSAVVTCLALGIILKSSVVAVLTVLPAVYLYNLTQDQNHHLKKLAEAQRTVGRIHRGVAEIFDGFRKTREANCAYHYQRRTYGETIQTVEKDMMSTGPYPKLIQMAEAILKLPLIDNATVAEVVNGVQYQPLKRACQLFLNPSRSSLGYINIHSGNKFYSHVDQTEITPSSNIPPASVY